MFWFEFSNLWLSNYFFFLDSTFCRHSTWEPEENILDDRLILGFERKWVIPESTHPPCVKLSLTQSPFRQRALIVSLFALLHTWSADFSSHCSVRLSLLKLPLKWSFFNNCSLSLMYIFRNTFLLCLCLFLILWFYSIWIWISVWPFTGKERGKCMGRRNGGQNPRISLQR